MSELLDVEAEHDNAYLFCYVDETFIQVTKTHEGTCLTVTEPEGQESGVCLPTEDMLKFFKAVTKILEYGESEEGQVNNVHGLTNM